MTDQRQYTRDQSMPSVPGPERAGPDWTGPASSTRDSTTGDLTQPEHPAEDGTVYESAAHESAVDGAVAEQPVDGGQGFDPDHRSVAAGNAGPDHPGAGYAVGVASVPDTEPDAGPVDRGELDSPDVAAQDAVETYGRDGAYGLNGHGADALIAPGKPNAGDETDGPVTNTVPPVPDADERAEIVAGEGRIVAAAGDDAAASPVTGAGQLLPGEAPDEPEVALFDGEMTERFRDRWQRLQMSFVDDPKTAAGLAGQLVDDVVTALRDAVDRQRSALEEWQSGHGVDAHSGDTERLRVAIRRYRSFLNRLLDL